MANQTSANFDIPEHILVQFKKKFFKHHEERMCQYLKVSEAEYLFYRDMFPSDVKRIYFYGPTEFFWVHKSLVKNQDHFFSEEDLRAIVCWADRSKRIRNQLKQIMTG